LAQGDLTDQEWTLAGALLPPERVDRLGQPWTTGAF